VTDNGRQLLARMTEGTAVVLERHMIGVVAGLVRDGIRYRTKYLGRPESELEVNIRKWFERAEQVAAEEVSWQLRSQVGADREGSAVNESEVIGVAEAMRILGRPRRTVVSWAPSLGGWGGGRGRAWQFHRAEVVAYAEQLKAGAA
jgi:hypothetical protein